MPLAGELKNWTVNAYTNETWTDLIAAEACIVKSIVIANDGGAANVSIRLTDDTPTARSTLLPIRLIEALDGARIDIDSLSLTETDRLQVWADAPGISFTASGQV